MKGALCCAAFHSKSLPGSQTADLGSFHFPLGSFGATICFPLSKDYKVKAAQILCLPNLLDGISPFKEPPEKEAF